MVPTFFMYFLWVTNNTVLLWFVFIFSRWYYQKNVLVYWYLPNHRTTWNDLKQLETSYNEQEMILNNLQQARSNLKRPGTTFNEQETTWNDLSWARNDLQEAKNNLKKPEKTYFNFMEPLNLINNQLKSFNVTKKQ